jgi:N-acetylmuramoyl-L-alanine amidase
MSETSRYLLLERRLRRTAKPAEPPKRCPEKAPPPALVVTTSVRAFDDGGPIDLRYPAAPRCEPAPVASAPAAPAAPAPPTSPVPPAAVAPAPVPPIAAPSPPSSPPPPPQPAPAAAAAPIAQQLATVEDDDDFAAQLRSLVEAASAPDEAPPAPAPEPAAPTAPAADPPAAEDSRYGVFDSIGEALRPPRTFDLGSVPVTAAFDAIEKSMDRHEAPRPAKPPAEPPRLDDMDLIEDLSLMPKAEAASWVGYSPGATDTLVVDSIETAAPAGVALKNWSAPGVTQFLNKPQQRTRAKSEVRQIVIHETVSSRWNGVHDPSLGVQFHLDRDGTLVQHNDALDMLWHVRSFSPHSVGIEVVNLVFDADAAPNPGEPDPGDRIPVAWGGAHGSHYVVPPLVQMEALAQTVDALRRELSIADNWIQVMPHPDPAHAAANPGRWYFVLGTNGHLYYKNLTADAWVGSHSALRDHADGAFPTLYCYLRLRKAMTPENAYAMARQMAEDAGGHRLHTYFDAGTGATLQMLDITDVV